jgi:hypothetical protein
VSSYYETHDLDLGGPGRPWVRPGFTDPPGTRWLPSFSCCSICADALPAKHRCTENRALLETATGLELVDGVGRGVGCPLDREAEMERRMESRGSFKPLPPPRPGFLVRLKRRLR